MGRKNLCIDFR